MKIIYPNTNLISRTNVLKETEKVCRIINSEFPAISSTKISEFHCAENNPTFQTFANNVCRRIRELIRNPIWKGYKEGEEKDFYLNLVNGIKQHKIANCADFSKLCNLICNINGIESKKAEMFLVKPDGRIGEMIDHAIHVISTSGKDIKMDKLNKLNNVVVIDPWLGFADYAPRAESRFKSDFHNFFKIPDGYSIMLNPYTTKEPKITDKVTAFFRENFPQFIIDKSKPLISPPICRQ